MCMGRASLVAALEACLQPRLTQFRVPKAPESPGEVREVMDLTTRYSLAVPALENSSSEELGDTTAVLIVHSPRAGRRKRGEAPPPQRWAAAAPAAK